VRNGRKATTVVTISVGDYDVGAAALINSLACAGFDGQIIIAHQGRLRWKPEPEAPVSFVDLSSIRGTKPFNLKAIALRHAGDGNAIYIDADCIVTHGRLLKIVDEAVAERPVFTTEGLLPISDVRHVAWGRALRGTAITDPAWGALACVAYINAGFMALKLPRDEQYLDRWQRLMDEVLVGDGDVFSTEYFPLADQDCLNAVILQIGRPVATLGPPDVWYRVLPHHSFAFMGVSLEPLLLHCTGKRKPWRLESPPLGRPDIYDKLFYRFAYEDTPWIKNVPRSPRSVERWMQDSLGSRLINRFRRAGNRGTYIAKTLMGSFR
jgi:hypothetical protein